MKDPNQKMRFTMPELSLMKGLFAGNDELIYIVRKVLFQFVLTDSEKEELKRTMTASASALIQKIFLPSFDADAPLHQMTDMVVALGADIKPLSPEGAWPYIQAKNIEISYIAQQLKVLNGEDLPADAILLKDLGRVNYETSSEKEEAYVNLIAWNFLASFIDSHLYQVKLLAGTKEETAEETLKRLAKDSAK